MVLTPQKMSPSQSRSSLLFVYFQKVEEAAQVESIMAEVHTIPPKTVKKGKYLLHTS